MRKQGLQRPSTFWNKHGKLKAADNTTGYALCGASSTVDRQKRRACNRRGTQALDLYDRVASYSDLALSARARLGRALLLYQTGAPGQAIVELEGERVLTRAFPEVDAALAAMLWAEGRDLALAESLWDTATQLEPRLSALEYVRESRR